ncbi:hypothetical protein EMCRGX_G000993 [Ephydatia muelleri]
MIRVALMMCILAWVISDSLIATEAQSITCHKVPSTSPCGSGLEKQRPNYYLPQTLPNGYYVTDALITLVQTYSEQPLEMCATSCQILQSIFNGSRCQNALNLLRTSSKNPDEWNSTPIGINCTDPKSYFFGNASSGFSNNTCYNLIDTLATAPSATGLDIIGLVQIAVPITGSILIVLLFLSTVFFIMKVIRRRYDIRSWPHSAKKESVELKGARAMKPIIRLHADEIQHYKDLFKDSLIAYAQLQCDKGPLGEGAFGKVYKGILTQPGSSVEHVAIKTIKNISSSNDIRNFFTESALMTQFHHQNILGLFGVCFDSPDGTPLMVLPFMVNGSLKSYLVKSRNPLSVKPDIFPGGLGVAIMTRMCTDIARGMSYLADQHFVHRDLAARNCLLDQDLSIKIGDFGLARDVYITDYYKASTHAALPVKWMPPEMLCDGISNEKTDVWAYGVTCWEVFSLGATPYPGVDNHLVLEHLMKGFRLVKPVLCTEEIYQIVQQCWFNSPENRPCFSQLLTEMNALLDIPYYV